MATKATAKPAAKPGRPSKFTEAIADQICERLADGESLRSICQADGMPAKATVFRWLREHQPFQDQYARAREVQAEVLVDEMLTIVDEECTMVKSSKHASSDDDGMGNTEVVFDTTAVMRNRLRYDARKWIASKLRPKVYGDVQEPQVGDPALLQALSSLIEKLPG